MLTSLVAVALQSTAIPNEWMVHHRHQNGERIASMAILQSEDRRSSLIVKCDPPYGNLSVQYVPVRSMGLNELGQTYWTGKPAIELWNVLGEERKKVGLVWQFGKNVAFATEMTPYSLATIAVAGIAQGPSQLVVEAYDNRRQPVTQTYHNLHNRSILPIIAQECRAAKQALSEKKRKK